MAPAKRKQRRPTEHGECDDLAKPSGTNTDRKRSGPVHGGRYVSKAIQLSERRDGMAFSLRVNFDPARTPENTRLKIIAALETVLSKLRKR
jgi:hypothetical protein